MVKVNIINYTFTHIIKYTLCCPQSTKVMHLVRGRRKNFAFQNMVLQVKHWKAWGIDSERVNIYTIYLIE